MSQQLGATPWGYALVGGTPQLAAASFFIDTLWETEGGIMPACCWIQRVAHRSVCHCVFTTLRYEGYMVASAGLT